MFWLFVFCCWGSTVVSPGGGVGFEIENGFLVSVFDFGGVYDDFSPADHISTPETFVAFSSSTRCQSS
jgi:hypothetical protein